VLNGNYPLSKVLTAFGLPALGRDMAFMKMA
jgi:hypothetical protein